MKSCTTACSFLWYVHWQTRILNTWKKYHSHPFNTADCNTKLCKQKWSRGEDLSNFNSGSVHCRKRGMKPLTFGINQPTVNIPVWPNVCHVKLYRILLTSSWLKFSDQFWVSNLGANKPLFSLLEQGLIVFKNLSLSIEWHHTT